MSSTQAASSGRRRWPTSTLLRRRLPPRPRAPPCPLPPPRPPSPPHRPPRPAGGGGDVAAHRSQLLTACSRMSYTPPMVHYSCTGLEPPPENRTGGAQRPPPPSRVPRRRRRGCKNRKHEGNSPIGDCRLVQKHPLSLPTRGFRNNGGLDLSGLGVLALPPPDPPYVAMPLDCGGQPPHTWTWHDDLCEFLKLCFSAVWMG